MNCALPGFVDSKNEEKTERNAGYLVVSHSGGGMLRQGTRKGIRRTPANREMRAHRVVKDLDIVEHEGKIITTDEEGNEITERVTVSEMILEIKVSHKTSAEMVVIYGFTARQNEQLALLADPQYDALWLELLGGYVSGGGQIIDPDTDWVGTGIFAWPLPQSFTITSILGNL